VRRTSLLDPAGRSRNTLNEHRDRAGEGNRVVRAMPTRPGNLELTAAMKADQRESPCSATNGQRPTHCTQRNKIALGLAGPPAAATGCGPSHRPGCSPLRWKICSLPGSLLAIPWGVPAKGPRRWCPVSHAAQGQVGRWGTAAADQPKKTKRSRLSQSSRSQSHAPGWLGARLRAIRPWDSLYELYKPTVTGRWRLTLRLERGADFPPDE